MGIGTLCPFTINTGFTIHFLKSDNILIIQQKSYELSGI
jgi:hypothetical protein